MAKLSSTYGQNVFINCPFDFRYKPLLEAVIFAVQVTGFQPRCALEAINAGQGRLERIMDIIAECRYGVHDISRTELSSEGLPRFNMPLELGIDLGCRRYGRGELAEKNLLIMDREQYRYQRFLSDIAGQDLVGHSDSPEELVRCIRDWLSAEPGFSMIPGGQHIYKRYRAFRSGLSDLCERMRLDPGQLTFGDFSSVVKIWLEENEI